MVKREVLKEQFLYFGVNKLSDEVISKCEEICITNGIDEDELVEIWMAFSVTHLGGSDPTLDTLVQMERNQFGKKQDLHPPPMQQSRLQDSTLVIYSATSSDQDLEDDILAVYNSTPKSKNKSGRRDEHTPDNRPGQGRSPRAIFSPASFSPTVTTPSSKYKARTNKGDAVCVYGEKKEVTDWQSHSDSLLLPSVRLLQTNMQPNTCYMFNQLRDVNIMFNELLQHRSKELVVKYSLQEPQSVGQRHQNQFVGVGRVCCESNGRLNAKSIKLESYYGKTVRMDVSQVETFSLFPGQIVAVEGENPSGSKLTAKKIYSDASSFSPPKVLNLSTEKSGPIQVVVAAGPFTQSDTMTYQPLEDLMEYIQKHLPHVVILIGPFIDAAHPHVTEGMLAETFQAFFEKIIDGIMEPLKELNTHVIIMPSSRDVHHHPVYPTPPFVLRKQYARLTLAPDPCVVDIEGILVAATSADVLLHIGKGEISQVRPGSDRLGRIAGHILSQRSFYPLYPPAEEINLDLELWKKYARLEVTPHILILPSDLRCFVKNLNSCIIVNPERLAKGLVGGNFARLEISCINENVNVNAQIVKI